MNEENFTPEYNNEPVPGTEVTQQPGLYPENIAPPFPNTNAPFEPVANDPNVVITTGEDGTFTVPQDAPVEDPRVDHVITLLEELNQKVEHLMEHAHQAPAPEIIYEGVVTLHPTPQGPPPDYNDGNL